MDTVTWRLFADLAEVAEGREHTVSVESDSTVGDAIDALLAESTGLRERVFDGDPIADDVNLMRTGSPTVPTEPVADGDEPRAAEVKCRAYFKIEQEAWVLTIG